MNYTDTFIETVTLSGIELIVEFQANIINEPDIDTGSREVTEIINIQAPDLENVSFMDWQYKGQRLDHYLMNNL